MGGFFTWAMRSAAFILFGIALLLPIITAVSQFIMLAGIGDRTAMSPYASGGLQGPIFPSLLLIIGSLQTAILPLFASAALWRWDMWMQREAVQ